MGAEKFDRRIKRQCSGKSLTDAREDNTNHASALLSGRIAINPIPTGGSKVPEAPKLPSKLRKSKKIQKNNYKFAQPTILSTLPLPTPTLALYFTNYIEMLQNPLVVLKNPPFYH